MAQLEHRKRSAIEAEDYDAAKVIKSEIDKLREAGGVVALGESVGAGSGGGGGRSRGHLQPRAHQHEPRTLTVCRRC